MKNIMFLLALFAVNMAIAQDQISISNTAIATDVSSTGDYDLFNVNTVRSAVAELDQVDKGTLFSLNHFELLSLRSTAPDILTMVIPMDHAASLVLHLYQVDIFSPEFILESSDGIDRSDVDLGIHYRGTAEGAEHSIIAISVFSDQIRGVIVADEANYNLGPITIGSQDYICYKSEDLNDELKSDLDFSCGSVEEDSEVYTEDELNFASRNPGDITDIYIEVDKTIFDAQGSVAGATAYATSLFNQNAAIYAAESVASVASQIFIWSTTDPYNGGSTGQYLSDFQAQFNGFNGDLAILLINQNIGGLAAGFSGICNPNPDQSMCISGQSGTIIGSFPTYSYNTYIFAHELGHLFGSRHTHACVWNGNNTAIDGCSGATEGGCVLPPNPASGAATVMSYCLAELNGGYVASAPFGLQPGNVIRASIAGATCLTPPAVHCSNGVQDADETGVDCGGVDCVACPPPCGAPDMTLSIITDQWGAETTWVINIDGGATVASGGPYINQAAAGSFPQPDVILNLADGSYNFTVSDTYGDGMCCTYGNGSYNLTDSEGTVLASGGTFGFSETTNFCVSSSTACAVFATAPVDLTKSFDAVGGIQDRVQVKWFKASPSVKYTDADAAACDVKFWPKRNLIPGTTTPTGPAIVASASDTTEFVDTKKFQVDGVTPREIFKWPVKFRKNSDAASAKRADPNIRYEWKVRCACEHGAGPESPWSDVKIFNVLDFDPVTGIYTPPPGAFSENETKSIFSSEMVLMPNPASGSIRITNADGLPESFDWYVMDMTGRVVFNGAVRGSKSDFLLLDLNGMAQGSYQLLMVAEQFSTSAPFLIRR